MTPRHELRRLMRHDMNQHDRSYYQFRRTLPQGWRVGEATPRRSGPPRWVWVAVYLLAAWVLWLYGGW